MGTEEGRRSQTLRASEPISGEIEFIITLSECKPMTIVAAGTLYLPFTLYRHQYEEWKVVLFHTS